MSYANPDRIVPVSRYPVYALLLPIAGTCLAGTLLTDVAYWRTTEMMWTDFSAWLVTAGTIIGYVALIAALIELSIRRVQRPPWPYLIGNLVALLVATLNMFVHTRDAWTSGHGVWFSMRSVSLLRCSLDAMGSRFITILPASAHRSWPAS